MPKTKKRSMSQITYSEAIKKKNEGKGNFRPWRGRLLYIPNKGKMAYVVVKG